MNISIIGPTGVGKGIQIERLVVKFDLTPIALGDLFRRNIKEQTGLGLLAKRYVSRAELVPDEVVEAMFEAWLRSIPLTKGVVLDGFPRTLNQALFLKALFQEVGRKLDGVIRLKASEESIVKRLSGQRHCRECQMVFSADAPFQSCPSNKCHGEHLYRSEDCEPGPVRVRFGIFEHTIGPLVEYYQKSGELIEVDGEGEIDEVSKAIARVIEWAGS